MHMDIKKTHKKKKQIVPDFSSWLYTTDEDFIEDRNLFENGHAIINSLYDRVLKLCLRHGITKEQVSKYEFDIHCAMGNYIQCIEIEQQIAKELTLIHFAHQINFSDPRFSAAILILTLRERDFKRAGTETRPYIP